MCFYHFIHFFYTQHLKALLSQNIASLAGVHSIFTFVTYMTSDTSHDISVNRFLQFWPACSLVHRSAVQSSGVQASSRRETFCLSKR